MSGRRRRGRALTDPLPVCPYGCGAPIELARLERHDVTTGARGPVALVNRLRAAPDDPAAALAVRRTAGGTRVARSLRAPDARPLEPGEHRHHDHDDVCTYRAAHMARTGAERASGVVDITQPRRTR